MCWIDKTVNVSGCVWMNTFPLSPVGLCMPCVVCLSALSPHRGLQCWECYMYHVYYKALSFHLSSSLTTQSGKGRLIQSLIFFSFCYEMCSQNRIGTVLLLLFFRAWMWVRVCSSVPCSSGIFRLFISSVSRWMWEDNTNSSLHDRQRVSICFSLSIWCKLHWAE